MKLKKLSFSKIFCFLSILFILTCCLIFGGRFIKLYLENRKVEIEEKNTLAKVLKDNNADNENFKSVNGQNYFTDNTNTNYLLYSNILWRIIKINDDNSVTAISDSSLTSLAFGKKLNYEKSHVFKWLNKTEDEYSGILEKNLNDKETYLQKTVACLDKIDKLENTPCKETNTDNYITLLPVVDYLNIGSKNSYLANSEYFYLGNSNSEDKIWYIDEDGGATLSTGHDIIGIRPVITIKANIDYISGDGTKEKPYKIEKENALFGSYVKIDDTIWRIYEVNDSEVRIMLNDYLKENNQKITYKYSNISSYHDDYKYGSIAYYLNHTFLNSLSCKNKIKEVSWYNGYYNIDTDYDYKYALDETIKSKVALMSIGNIFLNPELTNYHTMTGNKNKGTMIYTIQSNKKTFQKQISSAINVVPTISIDKELLKKGNGSVDSPYEME